MDGLLPSSTCCLFLKHARGANIKHAVLAEKCHYSYVYPLSQYTKRTSPTFNTTVPPRFNAWRMPARTQLHTLSYSKNATLWFTGKIDVTLRFSPAPSYFHCCQTPTQHSCVHVCHNPRQLSLAAHIACTPYKQRGDVESAVVTLHKTLVISDCTRQRSR